MFWNTDMETFRKPECLPKNQRPNNARKQNKMWLQNW